MNRTLPLRSLPLAVAVLTAGTLHAQIPTPGQPASDWADLSSQVPGLVLEMTADIAEMKAEDARRGPWPLRYGAVIPTDVGIESHGLWETADLDGSLVWRMEISSPGAYTIRVVFDEYEIPVGGQVFLYDPKKDEVLGAFTEFNNKANGMLGVEPVTGDTLVIEYVQQPWVTAAPKLNVGQVIHDYLDLRSTGLWPAAGQESGADGGCGTIDINCPDGDNYQVEKRAVVRTLANNVLCTGAILNNTAEDETPYMLTAEHCGNATNGTFRFKYERSGCGSGSAPTNFNLSGATQLATSAGLNPGTDSALYVLSQSIPSNYDPYYAGWSRSNSSSGIAVSIGHSDGSPKTIATDANGSTQDNSAHRAFWSSGTINGGHSGGPLFDSSGRVMGPACCVDQFVCGNQNAWYGRLSKFWNQGNLAQWLDPAGLGLTFLDGLDPSGPGGGDLTVTGISPSVIEAVNPGTDQIVTITGTGFDPSTTTIEVDGIDLGGLFPAVFQVVSSTQITFDPPDMTQLGLVIVTVNDGLDSASTLLNVLANDPPALEAGTGDEPVQWLSATGLDFTMGGAPGDTFVLGLSFTNSPSSIPGLVSIDIGNNFADLYTVGTFVVPANGYATTNLGITLPPVTTVYFEGVTIDPLFTTPFPDTNEQEALYLF